MMDLFQRNNHTIRGVCLDLDGTLIEMEGGTIPDDAVAAIRKYRKKHPKRKLFFATGRNLAEIPRAVFDLNFDGFSLLGGKVSYLRDPKSGIYAKVHERGIDPHCLHRIVDLMILSNLPAVFVLEEQIVYLDEKGETAQVGMISGRKDFKPIGSVDDLLDEDAPPVFRVDCVFPADEDHELMGILPGMQLRRDGEMISLEMVNNGKRDGLLAILRQDFVPRTQILYIGNARSDMDLLRYCGFSAVMGDCTDEEVRNAAGYVTAPILEGGIAQALKHYKQI